MERLLLALAGGLLCATAAQGQQPPAPPSAAADQPAQTEDFRLKADASQRLTVPVKLSGAGPFNFLVDTGADHTAISRDLAVRLNLADGRDAHLHSVDGVSTVSTAKIPSIQLTRKPVAIDQAPLLDATNIGADGILGVDTLSSQRVVFDFVAQTMSVVPSSVAEPRDEPGAIVIAARGRKGRLIISEATAEGRQVTIVLDTGAEVSIGNEALRKQLRIGSRRAADGRVEIESVTGARIAGDVVLVKKIAVGDVTLSNLLVVFADAHTFSHLGLANRPALLLGMNAMRAFKKVSIDFANKKFRVVVPEHSERDVELARLHASGRRAGR